MHVYKITNVLDGKFYIGKHVGDDLLQYFGWKVWSAENNKDDNPRLFNAMRKYGIENFIVESLAQPIDDEQLCKMEMFFIRTFCSQNPEIGYNISAGGDGGRPSYMWSPEQREAARERALLNPRFNRTGAKQTPESNRKNREAHLGKPRGCGKVTHGS
jgi:group I intron endonuclease